VAFLDKKMESKNINENEFRSKIKQIEKNVLAAAAKYGLKKESTLSKRTDTDEEEEEEDDESLEDELITKTEE
jgi:hypothetical protein